MKPNPPYYAVIFTSSRTTLEEGPYAAMAGEMLELARKQPGFIGVDHAREAVGITVSYWDSLKSIADWKSHSRHVVAQERGRDRWYESYTIRICRVEREYSFDGNMQELDRASEGGS